MDYQANHVSEPNTTLTQNLKVQFYESYFHIYGAQPSHSYSI